MFRANRTPAEIAAAAEAVDVIPDAAILTPAEAAQFLANLGRPITEKSLSVYRAKRPKSPPFAKRGRYVRYVAGDLRRFASGTD